MTAEEAIKHLKLIVDNEAYSGYFQKVCRTAIESLEKEVPKKPAFYDDGINPYDASWSDNWHFECPRCGDTWNQNEFGSGMVHCWTCGQHIDWSEGGE